VQYSDFAASLVAKRGLKQKAGEPPVRAECPQAGRSSVRNDLLPCLRRHDRYFVCHFERVREIFLYWCNAPGSKLHHDHQGSIPRLESIT
jgi:hypothetical protein